MILFVALAAAVLGAAPAPPVAAMAPHGSRDYDIQCMLAAQSATGKADATSKERVGLIMMFYFGRVDSVVSGDALKQRMRSVTKSLEGHQLMPMLQDCAKFMNERGLAMDNIRRQLLPEPKPAPHK